MTHARIRSWGFEMFEFRALTGLRESLGPLAEHFAGLGGWGRWSLEPLQSLKPCP